MEDKRPICGAWQLARCPNHAKREPCEYSHPPEHYGSGFAKNLHRPIYLNGTNNGTMQTARPRTSKELRENPPPASLPPAKQYRERARPRCTNLTGKQYREAKQREEDMGPNEQPPVEQSEEQESLQSSVQRPSADRYWRPAQTPKDTFQERTSQRHPALPVNQSQKQGQEEKEAPQFAPQSTYHLALRWRRWSE